MRFHVTRRTPTSVGLLSLLLVGALAAKAVAAESACAKNYNTDDGSSVWESMLN